MTTGEAHQTRDPHRETRKAQETHTLIDALLGGLDGRVATGLELPVARR